MSRTNTSKNVVSPRRPKAQNSGFTAIITTHKRASIPISFCHQLSLSEVTDARPPDRRMQIQANIARIIRMLGPGCTAKRYVSRSVAGGQVERNLKYLNSCPAPSGKARPSVRCRRLAKRHRLCIRANGISVDVKGSRLELRFITLRAAVRAPARVPRVRGKPHPAHNHPRFHSPPRRAPSVQPR